MSASPESPVDVYPRGRRRRTGVSAVPTRVRGDRRSCRWPGRRDARGRGRIAQAWGRGEERDEDDEEHGEDLCDRSDVEPVEGDTAGPEDRGDRDLDGEAAEQS